MKHLNIFLLFLLCCGVAYGGGRKRDKSLLTTVDSEVERDGGIDPTTVPILDEDLVFMVQVVRTQIQADEAHAITRGEGIVVAVLDGGFNLDHPDLAGRLLGSGYDAIDGDFDAHDTGNGFDDDGDGTVDEGLGHGTFVAGMVLLSAPDAMILPIRVRDDEGWGAAAETALGLELAYSMGADVVNMSVSNASWKKNDVLKVIDTVAAAGVPVIVSAGNDARSIFWNDLTRLDSTLCAGAVDAYDVLAPFSNYSAYGGIVHAPGVDLFGPIGAPTDDTRGTWSGTSFSAGLVSGAAALVLARRPELTVEELYAHLETTCDPAYDAAGEPMGSGRINLRKVVAP